MPHHTTNRAAFLKCDATVPLLALYTTLVAIELALKDHAGFCGSHDLQLLASCLPASAMTPSVQAALNTVNGSLQKLRCTTKTGAGAHVKPPQYPDVRYTRFVKDGFVDGSPDADVSQALEDVKVLAAELKRAGVSI